MSGQRFYRVPVFRVSLVRDSSVRVSERPASSPASAAELMRAFFPDDGIEHFAVAFLDARNHITGVQEVAVGTVDRCPVFPREVFRGALACNAKAVIVAHNHPSGDTSPSADDHALTRKLREAGEAIGIALLDHLIVRTDGSSAFYSFANAGSLR